MLFLSFERAEFPAYDEFPRECYSGGLEPSYYKLHFLFDRGSQQFDDEYCCAEPSISGESHVPYSHWPAYDSSVAKQLFFLGSFPRGHRLVMMLDTRSIYFDCSGCAE